jgi:membrane-associated protein
LVLARFIPIVRTFAPFVAGIARMPWIKFQMYNVLGAVIWVCGLLTLGFIFGNVPWIRQYLNVIILGGIGAAAVPAIAGLLWKLLRR